MPLKDPEARKAYLAAHHQKNREKALARQRERYAEKAQDPAWLEQERARNRERMQAEYQATKDQPVSEEERQRRAEYQKTYREEHRDRHNELNRLSKERNREKIQAKRASPEEQAKERERRQRWLERNPDYMADYEKNRRQRPENWPEVRRQFYLDHRQEISAQKRERYQHDPAYREGVVSRSRTRYRERREEILRQCRLYRIEHADGIRQWQRVYRETRRDRDRHNAANRRSAVRRVYKIRAYSLAYRQRNKRRISAQMAAYYLQNKDRIQARNKQWWSDHPEKAIQYQNQRRAAIENTPGSHTGEDILAIWERQKHKCAVKGCIYPITDEKGSPHKYQVDHVQPVTKGGSNGPENLQILCRTHNAKKHNKEANEWAQEHGLLFA